MKNESVFENTSEPESTPATPVVPTTPASASPGTAPDTESSVAKTRRVLDNTEMVTGGSRQTVNAGLLGVCIAFLIALLGMQPKAIDASLSIALIAFSIAMPLIGWGFLQSFMRAKPTPGWLVLQSILISSAVAESVGELAVCIGILFVLKHLSFYAFVAFIWSGIFAVFGVLVLAFIGLFIYAWFNVKAEERAKKQQATSEAAPSITPVQGQEVIEPVPTNS